ncbi:MAG: hypothetical protein JWQ89_2491 [Devosia sp.]|nr:hypothetical protein [Devosia sp.]
MQSDVRARVLAVYKQIKRLLVVRRFAGSTHYWETRYRDGGNSGAGSYGRLADFKARFLNDFVDQNGIRSVIEFGCGDGNQLMLARYPRYIGLDVSYTAIDRCRNLYKEDSTKSFLLLDSYAGETADLSLSLDVIFHLVEDEVFEAHMNFLFDAARRSVIVYSSNVDRSNSAAHVRHRRFTDWVAVRRPEWVCRSVIENEFPLQSDPQQESFADFYVFQRA